MITPTEVKLRLLGSAELVNGAQRFPAGDPLQCGLLAALAVRANSRVGAEALAAALWETPPRTALRQVQTQIWKLRELLGQAFAGCAAQQRPQLLDQAGGYLLFVEPRSIDLVLFEHYARKARQTSAEGEFAAAARDYDAALSLWKGPAFAGIPLKDASAPGVRAEAIKLEDRHIAVTEERIGVDLILGRHHEVIPELRELVGRHPLRERLRLHLIRALGRAGGRQEAVRVYREGHRILVEELGLDLSPELKEAYRLLLVGAPEQTEAAPRAGAGEYGAGPEGADPGEAVARRERGTDDRSEVVRTLPLPFGPGLVGPVGRRAGRDRPPAHLEPILEQLLIGATDTTASRRLGLSSRTFSRRVSELLDYLGVATRFQAGAEAHDRGWITTQQGEPGPVGSRPAASRSAGAPGRPGVPVPAGQAAP
ncbi:BTAD domain-containing putative transcriptional regulator [Streptomyces sp. DH8]|uniref:BTAD domain-containing putative transcriptional regulator n=1 Tax=Streptomyces sp. DH8 TaxID=2857008 RepID=UPI001E5109B6|nr:BTAD domain-containing putative transcriptional regulator [Streptomyces sp. DH8]